MMSLINCMIVSPEDQAILCSGFNVWNGIWDCYSMGFGSCPPNISRLILGTTSFSTVIFPLSCYLKTHSNRTLYPTVSFPTIILKQSSPGDPSVGSAEDTVEQSWHLCHTQGRKDRLQLLLLLTFLLWSWGFFFSFGCCF